MTGSSDGLVELAVVGRATGEAVEGIRAPLEGALAQARPFAVLFDRSRMTALTPDGRDALSRWEAELTPRLASWCVAWADVYDERRGASLLRARERAEPGASPYPQDLFVDRAAALAWLADRLPPR